MKLRRLSLCLALVAFAAVAAVIVPGTVEAIPNNPPAPYPGACGYIPYMTLGESCIGAGYLVGSAMTYSQCQAQYASYANTAVNNHQCTYGDWTFQCRPAKWCPK
jgi:hypothetical protein